MKQILLGILSILVTHSLLHGASRPPTPPPVPQSAMQLRVKRKQTFDMQDEIRQTRQRDILYYQRFQRIQLLIPIIFLPKEIRQREWRKRIHTMEKKLTFHFHNEKEYPLDLLPAIMTCQRIELMRMTDYALPPRPPRITTTPPLADQYEQSSLYVPSSQKSAYADRLSQSMHESPSTSRNPSGKNTPQRLLSCEDIAAIAQSAPEPIITIKRRVLPCPDTEITSPHELNMIVGFLHILVKFGKAHELAKSLSQEQSMNTVLHTCWGTPPQIALAAAIEAAERKIKNGKYTESVCYMCEGTPPPEEDGLYQTCIHLLLEYGSNPSCVHGIKCTHEGIKRHLEAALKAQAGSAADA